MQAEEEWMLWNFETRRNIRRGSLIYEAVLAWRKTVKLSADVDMRVVDVVPASYRF